MSNAIFDILDNLDKTATIAGYRAICNSAMARTIGSIRQHIRARAAQERDADNPISIDDRNDKDEQNQEKEPPYGLGYDRRDPLLQASQFHAVYEYARDQLETLSMSPFDRPMPVTEMLKYMVQRAVPNDEKFLEAMAEITGLPMNEVKQFREAQARMEQEQLTEQAPEIIHIFEGFEGNGCEEALDNLTTVDQHQMGVKIVEKLLNEKSRIMQRALRARRMDLLANIPLIDEGVDKVKDWTSQFELKNRAELQEAIDAGRNIRVLSDVA